MFSTLAARDRNLSTMSNVCVHAAYQIKALNIQIATKTNKFGFSRREVFLLRYHILVYIKFTYA